MKALRIGRRISPLLTVILIDSIGYTIVVPVLAAALIDEQPQMMIEASAGLRYLAYGVAIGIYELAMLYAAPVLGEISDGVGRKRILILSMAGVAASFLLIGSALIFNVVALLIIARLIGGATAGSQSVAQAAAVDSSSDEERTTALNLCLFASSLGFILGPLIGGALSHDDHVRLSDFTAPMLLTAGLAVAGIVLLALGFHDRRPPPSTVRRRINLFMGVAAFRDALSLPTVRHLMIVFGLMQISWGTYFLYLPSLLLNRFNEDAGTISLVMALLGVGFCLAYGLFLPVLERWFSLRAVTIWGLWLTLVLIAVSVASHSMAVQWLIALPVAITVSVAYGAIIALFSRSVSDERQGWILGISISVNALVWGLSSIVNGMLSAYSYLAPFVLSLLALTFSALLMTTGRPSFSATAADTKETAR